MLTEKSVYLFESGYDLNVSPSSFIGVDDISEEVIGDEISEAKVVLDLCSYALFHRITD